MVPSYGLSHHVTMSQLLRIAKYLTNSYNDRYIEGSEVPTIKSNKVLACSIYNMSNLEICHAERTDDRWNDNILAAIIFS